MLKYLYKKERRCALIKTDITVPVGYTAEDIKNKVIERLPVEKSEIGEIEILKQTLLVGSLKDIFYKLTVGISFSEEREKGLLKMKKKVSEAPDYTLNIPKSKLASRPVVVGSGPAGLFAALALSEAGARPIVLERGLSVDERIKKVNEFILTGKLDTECNIQFGEGGAGTYSDGKLKVGGMDACKKFILNSFVEAGANADIIYSSSAHLGTDKLSGIVKSLRLKMTGLGAEFIFGARLSDLDIKSGRIKAVKYERAGETVTLDAETVILATGHSSRDVFELLDRKGIPMRAKGFGVGMRVEHPREYIDTLVYGKNHDSCLGSASYHLVTHLPSGRSVYSFCMCPGGKVVAATSAEERVVTNGMSEYKRMAENSNAAILVSVTPEDFGSESALAGLDYQEKIERAAFMAAGSDYKAPALTLGSFIKNERATLDSSVNPSYSRGAESVSPEKYLPEYITDSLRAGFFDFDGWMKGYYLSDAILTGAETRTTSPVRILRSDNYEANGISGLYPVGEGAGYAGGIISSAADGLKCALSILESSNL